MGPEIALILTIIIAGPHPDVVRSIHEPSIEKCWEDAAAFFAQGIPKRWQGAAGGLAAECRTNAEALKPDDPS